MSDVPSDTEIIHRKWRWSFETWIYGLFSAFIGGGASAVTAGVSGSMIDPEKFNLNAGLVNVLKLTGACFVLNGLLTMFAYLKQSPLPLAPVYHIT